MWAGTVAAGDDEITVIAIPILSGRLIFHRSGSTPRFNVPTLFQLHLTNRSSAHHYSITIDPSENLGSLTVLYDSDDTKATAITNHTAGDPITVGANLGDTDSDGLYSTDSTIVTLAFTPTTTSTNDTEGTLEITSAKLYRSDTDTTGTDATLPSTNPLTFTIAEAKDTISLLNTGTGPTPIIKFYGSSGTQRGPFDVDISFESKNYVSYQANTKVSVGIQRGIQGFRPEDIKVSGNAEASLTGKLWGIHSTTGAIARINPTKSGTVEIYVPANVVTEIGTGLPNVASERFIVNVELSNRPWDVNEDGSVDQTDLALVKAAVGQGLHRSTGRGGVWADSSIENARLDVDGDMYVTEADVKMVEDNLDVKIIQGLLERSVQKEPGFQLRSVVTPPPDASVWMPDANLRQCVRKRLKLADDTELTQAKMINLSKLSCGNKGIRDITGLEYATSLEWLNLKRNDISDLTPLAGLTNLTYLNIRGNQIRNIAPLSNLTNLKELWMTNNDVRDISPLSNLVKLRVLRMSGNPVLDLSPLYPLIQGKLKWYGSLDVPRYPPWDVNQDDRVDATDVALVTAALGQTGDSILVPRMDVNRDGTVDQDDLTLVTDNLDTDGVAPSSIGPFTLLDPVTLEGLDREALEGYLNTLCAESDGSAKYVQAITMIEHVLAASRPQETLLLANYPNPFNPETWIPYQLANPSDVQITIYDVRGQVIRRLDLGHRETGRYTTQDRAVYWDGRNDVGERVASGMYFYRLKADNISLLRKMLILK